jgi:hypothetical protein
VPSWLEQTIGVALLLLILVDVFLTVLYARMGAGVFSPRLARVIWRAFRGAARPFGRRAGKLLSFCGPIILVTVLIVWGLSLTLGTALIIHPKLGSSVTETTGTTPRDFATALYAGGGSISIVGGSNFEPKTAGFRLLFLVDSLVGMSVISLTVTYLLQVYNALYRRNATAFALHLASAETADAVEILVGLAPENQAAGGYTNLSAMASEIAGVKESHHFYPVLFYFRFPDAQYAVSRIALLTLDAVSLIKSGLDDRKHAWLKESVSLTQLWHGSLDLVTGLGEAFLPEAHSRERPPLDPAVAERWRRRYFAALRRLREAGIHTIADEEEGVSSYVRLRNEWDTHIHMLAHALGYTTEEIDPATCKPEMADQRPPVRTRLRSAG